MTIAQVTHSGSHRTSARRYQEAVFTLLALLILAAGGPLEATAPSILFCMADDWGWPHAGAYGDQAVATPHFDRLAREGVLLHHAYVASPSCTPSRNAVITGKYFWQLGPGANLWSTLPIEHESFVHLLRDNGYATGRNHPKSWGPGRIDSWMNHHGSHPVTTAHTTFAEFMDTNQNATPFFFWLATSDPHRGYEPGSGERSGIDPAKAHLFAHCPESSAIRSDVADYYFEVQRWDRLVGEAVSELEARGLLDSTIVIMTGDHGMPFPRCKGNLYDSGTRVPFAVRWGDRITPGRVVDDFVSLTDIAPTLLDAAGVAVPSDMTGRSFLDLMVADENGRLDPKGRPDVVFGRERHTPAQRAPNTGGYPSRGLRTGGYLYIRNFRPNLWPAGTGELVATNLPGQWFSDCDGGPTKSYLLDNRDRDDEHRRAFDLCFSKRPAEELYDLTNDPGQIDNVAAKLEYASQLAKLSARLHQRLAELGDPRASDPDYAGFDAHPYYGRGGGGRSE